tara:strand:- start:10419 stop:10616 length:198 start_codon:yes stop_codon:yes gene_type:complete
MLHLLLAQIASHAACVCHATSSLFFLYLASDFSVTAAFAREESSRAVFQHNPTLVDVECNFLLFL